MYVKYVDIYTLEKKHQKDVHNVEQEKKHLLKEKNKEWETLAQALMEYETLTGDEIKQILSGEKVDKSKESPVSEDKRTHASVPEI